MEFIRNNPILKQRRRNLRREQTDAEKLLWRYLRGRRLRGIKFYRQYSVGPFILDFFSAELRLAVEVDGGQHLTDERRQYDEERSEYLRAYGIEVIRFWNNEVLNNVSGVLNRITEEIEGIGCGNPLNPP